MTRTVYSQTHFVTVMSSESVVNLTGLKKKVAVATKRSPCIISYKGYGETAGNVRLTNESGENLSLSRLFENFSEAIMNWNESNSS